MPNSVVPVGSFANDVSSIQIVTWPLTRDGELSIFRPTFEKERGVNSFEIGCLLNFLVGTGHLKLSKPHITGKSCTKYAWTDNSMRNLINRLEPST